MSNLIPKNLIDEFAWIELAGFKPDGTMVRDEFVKVKDSQSINSWRQRFNNTDIFSSICLYKQPNCQSDFIAPIFFDIDCNNDLKAAKKSAIILSELIRQRIRIDYDQIGLFFSGNKGFHITVSCKVFEPKPTELILKLYKKMAQNAQAQGVSFVDTSVYTNRRLWRLVNSVNSKSGLYKIPLLHKELLYLSIDAIKLLAKRPRCQNSLSDDNRDKNAVKWFKTALSCMKKLETEPDSSEYPNPSDFKNGWRTPPCITNILNSSLPDGIRHNAYLCLARFYSWINMHPQELEEKIAALDSKNPIPDPKSIQRIIDWASKHSGFAGCENDVLKQFCNKENCFYYKIKTQKGESK